MLRRGGGEIRLEKNRGRIDEFHRDHACSNHRGFKLSGGIQDGWRNGGVSGYDEARHIAREQSASAFLEGRHWKTLEIAELSGPEDLNAFYSKITEETREGQARPVDGGLSNEAVQTA